MNPQANHVSKEANIAAQEHLAENISAGDVQVAVQSFAEDAVDHDPVPGQGPGRADLQTFWQTVRTRVERIDGSSAA